MKYKFNKEDHVHELLMDGVWKGLTGTSSVVDVLAKQLSWWASGLAVSHLGWTNSKIRVDGKYKTIPLEERLDKVTPRLNDIKRMTEEEFLKELDVAYNAHMNSLKNSAQSGADRHEMCEKYVKAHMAGNKRFIPDKSISSFVEWTDQNVKRFLWSELNCFNEDLFVGGISDAGVELKNGEYAIIDFKSSKDAYPSHFFQIAGYDLQISKNGGYTATGEKVFDLDKEITQYIVFPFGMTKPTAIVNRDVMGCRQAFTSLLNVHRQLGKMDS